MAPTVGLQGDGYVTEFSAGGSQIRWSQGAPGDDPATILPLVIARLRSLNRLNPAREYSLAITHSEEALHWLTALEGRSNHGQ
jgi:hypothetical protein